MMRNLVKANCPQLLVDNADQWAVDYGDDPTNGTKKYRYRHREIKNSLLSETYHKCVYCESKIGHVTPGDVEHMQPSSIKPELHFEWTNLTIACTECNRRKSNYYDEEQPFLDPYNDDVESMVIHHGPILGWNPGDHRSEITVRKLELHNSKREQLILRKIEKIEE